MNVSIIIIRPIILHLVACDHEG